MASIEISDDELVDLEEEQHVKGLDSTLLSSDEGDGASSNVTSDDELPAVEVAKKKAAVIDNLFSKSSKSKVQKPARNFSVFKNKPSAPSPSTSGSGETSNERELMPRDVAPGVTKMIAGVSVNLPVNPYGSQLALMSTLIRALKNGQNCLLESPTGSGKTLALLCGALAWLTAEKSNIEKQKAEQYFRDINEYDECSPMQTSPGSVNSCSPLKRPLNVAQCDGSPMKASPDMPDNMFQRNTFGVKSIYDSPNNDSLNMKRKEFSPNSSQDSPVKGQVHIHKRPKVGAKNGAESTLENAKQFQNTYVVPRIYYGARTHKQLEQVIKEFRRTTYCEQMKMTVLASRDHACIRDYDRHQWPTRNEMCRACAKKVKTKNKSVQVSNCKYYDNRAALRPERLPPAFDLEDLVRAGHDLTACPYFAAREMVAKADIVFCPYNYLIDPLIAESMRISLADSVVIIDEAHNIEDVCRDSATFVFTRDHLADALKELEVASQYRYSASLETQADIDSLILTLKNWDQWFVNQSQLVSNLPLVNNEAVHLWQSEHFVTTLTNHNLGPEFYPPFQQSVCQFSQTLQNSPESLTGVTQPTAALLDSLSMVLGYLFRDGCQFVDDYKPALVRSTADNFNKTSFKKKDEQISLRLMCMNPAVVFSRVSRARTVALASGTLTPLVSLESELGAQFPLKISPKHVISPDRVWIGTLSSDQQGRPLSCKSADTKEVATQDALGAALVAVCRHTPHGVLAFLPSYHLMNTLVTRWQETGVWRQLTDLKHVFLESKNAKDHNDNMEDYYKYVSSEKGAALLAVYRGKVSEGMDFKDHQARAVVTVGVPYPNTFDMSVKAKMQYNERHCRSRGLLSGQMWLKVQAYRALNQAVGRCVRHVRDWGAVLLLDARFTHHTYTEHLSKWVLAFLQQNHHTFSSLTDSPQGLASFMQAMKIADEDELMADL